MDFLVENNGLRVNGYGPLHGLSYAQLTRLKWAIHRKFIKSTIQDKITKKQKIQFDYSDQGDLYKNYMKYLTERLSHNHGDSRENVKRWLRTQPDLKFFLRKGISDFRINHFTQRFSYEAIGVWIIDEIRYQMSLKSQNICYRFQLDNVQIELKFDFKEDYSDYQNLESFTG